MKQIIQNYKTGKLSVEEIPAPMPGKNKLLLKTTNSLISAGTERAKIETARMGLIEKAVSRLDLIKTVANNIKQEGVLLTFSKAMNKLDTPISLGYSCSGEVIDAGDTRFKKGDKVACVGENYAAHSEINSMPADFAVNVPLNVDMEDASFVGLGAIALNATVIAQVKENENTVVIGLGLLGQIVTQILKAKNCRVLGIEIDENKLALARVLGLDASANPLKDDIESLVRDFSHGKGADAIIITAASNNNLPIELAGKIAREKGRIILVGAMPITIPRKEYYEKELYFVISRGFGAGLYFPIEDGREYSFGYSPVSFSENMQNFLSLLAQKKINIKPLISHRYKLTDAQKAYELINTPEAKYLGIIFEYNDKIDFNKRIDAVKSCKETKNKLNIGFIGAGSFAQGYLLPAIRKHENVCFSGVATANSITAANAARKFGFGYYTTDYNEILNDNNTSCIFITTRHGLHARLAIEALKKGKKIFLEKPLCMSESELKDIIKVYRSASHEHGHNTLHLMVGFNRRFSPFIKEARKFFSNRTAPVIIDYRVNAGYLPPNHWVHSTSEGGGRIVGEMCHFIDLLIYLTESYPVEVSTVSLKHPDKTIPAEDNVLIHVKMSDGSIGSINYNSIGDPSFSRERIEIFGGNSVISIDNFSKALFSRSGIKNKISRLNRDMGHTNEIDLFIDSISGNMQPLISFNDIIATTLTTFKVAESLRTGLPVKIDLNSWIK